MKNPRTFLSTNAIARLLIALAIVCALSAQSTAQTPGGTTISNQASATYSDGTNSYSTVSNTVTVTVSNVSGLAITPDAGSNPTVVAGQTGVLYNFTVTNTGNFTDQVRFLASGASVRVVGPGTITQAVIDKAKSGDLKAAKLLFDVHGCLSWLRSACKARWSLPLTVLIPTPMTRLISAGCRSS